MINSPSLQPSPPAIGGSHRPTNDAGRVAHPDPEVGPRKTRRLDTVNVKNRIHEMAEGLHRKEEQLEKRLKRAKMIVDVPITLIAPRLGTAFASRGFRRLGISAHRHTLGTGALCATMRAPRSSLYRTRNPAPMTPTNATAPRRSPRALKAREVQEVGGLCQGDRGIDHHKPLQEAPETP